MLSIITFVLGFLLAFIIIRLSLKKAPKGTLKVCDGCPYRDYCTVAQGDPLPSKEDGGNGQR